MAHEKTIRISVCDERTLEWQNRTQTIVLAPATRGGQKSDHRALYHTMAGVSVVALLLQALVLSGIRLRRAASPFVDGHPGAITLEQTGLAGYIPGAYVRQAAPPPAVDRVFVSLPGHVPPPAPVWIDGARQHTGIPVAIGAFTAPVPPGRRNTPLESP